MWSKYSLKGNKIIDLFLDKWKDFLQAKGYDLLGVQDEATGP